jgi:hypothetical protein
MPTASDKRVARYAGLSIVHLSVVLVVLFGPFRSLDRGLVILVASLPLLWAWGHYQADVATNPRLDDTDRTWWRIVLWCLPWAMTLYLLRQVRTRRAID